MASDEFDFERLKVYQKALEFIHKVLEIYKNLPREFQHTIGDNLVRASISVANNIAEGSGKKSKKEKVRFYSISLDSARECVSVFNVLLMEKFLEARLYPEMRRDAKEITSMLCGLIDSLN